MATKFIRPETIPLYIQIEEQHEMLEQDVITKLEEFKCKDKMINHQLQQIKLHLEWNRENRIHAQSPIKKN